MTLWLLAAACGQGLAAVVIERTSELGDVVFYHGVGGVTLVVALGLFLISPWTQRHMEDVDHLEPQEHGDAEAAPGSTTVQTTQK